MRLLCMAMSVSLLLWSIDERLSVAAVTASVDCAVRVAAAAAVAAVAAVAVAVAAAADESLQLAVADFEVEQKWTEAAPGLSTQWLPVVLPVADIAAGQGWTDVAPGLSTL